MSLCRSEDNNDPINRYIVKCVIDIESVPIDVIRDSANLYGHRVESDYIYGVKLVSQDAKHMFASATTEPYEVDKTYTYEDSDKTLSKFHNFCNEHRNGAHGAGLWAYPCFANSIKINNRHDLCVPILVKFPLQTTIVLGTYAIKGKYMTVVSTDRNDVDEYLSH